MEYKKDNIVLIKGNDNKIKKGVIRSVFPDVKMLMPEFDWNGDAYIVDCNEKTKEGIRFCNIIPLENIIKKARFN